MKMSHLKGFLDDYTAEIDRVKKEEPVKYEKYFKE
jgi:hypothetical protein